MNCATPSTATGSRYIIYIYHYMLHTISLFSIHQYGIRFSIRNALHRPQHHSWSGLGLWWRWWLPGRSCNKMFKKQQHRKRPTAERKTITKKKITIIIIGFYWETEASYPSIFIRVGHRRTIESTCAIRWLHICTTHKSAHTIRPRRGYIPKIETRKHSLRTSDKKKGPRKVVTNRREGGTTNHFRFFIYVYYYLLRAYIHLDRSI